MQNCQIMLSLQNCDMPFTELLFYAHPAELLNYIQNAELPNFAQLAELLY